MTKLTAQARMQAPAASMGSMALALAATAMLLGAGCTRFHDGSIHHDAPARDGDPSVRFAGPGHSSEDTRLTDARSSQNAGLGLFGDIQRSAAADQGAADDATDNLRRISYAREGADFDPAVDPDGEYIVFASTRHRENEAIYRKRITGSTVTQLTDSAARDVMPTFSPDGERIAFASDRSGTWDLYIMDAAGGQAVQITDDNRHNIHPSFSPDGGRLVYASFGGPSQQWEMVVIDLDRPGTRQYLGPGLFPSWSPVDDRILFQRARQRGSRWFSVWMIELDSNGEAGAPTEIAASANAAVISPSWGPDGDHLVFCTVVDPGADEQQGSRPTRADVWVVRTDGHGRARLTGDGFANLQPAWASDGTIYFVSNRGGEGVENIWAVRPDRAIRLAQPRGRESDGPSARAE